MSAPTSQAPGSLLQLQEIPLPAPVSYIPQTGGWLAVLILALVLFAIAAWRRWRVYCANRYRREALAALASLEHRLADGATRAQALIELPALVKRTALSSMRRDCVAALSGDDWLLFLDRTAGRDRRDFATGPGRLLWQLAYAPRRDIADDELAALVALLRRWIAHHVAI